MHEMVWTDRRDDFSRNGAVAVLVFSVCARNDICRLNIRKATAIHLELDKLYAFDCSERENRMPSTANLMVIESQLGKEQLV